VSSTDASAGPAESPGIEPTEAQGLLFDGDFSPLPTDMGFRGTGRLQRGGDHLSAARLLGTYRFGRSRNQKRIRIRLPASL
jgi:hypothetical protein